MLFQGRIVWAPVADKHGNPPKHRPVAIISSDDDISSLSEVAGVVCSHTAAEQPRLADCWVQLPYHRNRNCSTKFAVPTVAIPTWVVPVSTSGHKADNVGGFVQKRLLLEIIETINEIRLSGCEPEVSCGDVLCRPPAAVKAAEEIAESARKAAQARWSKE